MNEGISANLKAWKELMNGSVLNKETEKMKEHAKSGFNGVPVKKGVAVN